MCNFAVFTYKSYSDLCNKVTLTLRAISVFIMRSLACVHVHKIHTDSQTQTHSHA